eukprot:m.238633 g.238633  ORF g.238633 m.238633 type:complete len:328 (-) comp21900_c0_seq1:19-1002(-)
MTEQGAVSTKAVEAAYAQDEVVSDLVDLGALPWEQPMLDARSLPPITKMLGLEAEGLEARPTAVPMPVEGAFGLLATVLSPAECSALMGLGEKLGMKAANSKKQYRNCDRTVFRSERLASLLWERVREHIPTRVDDAVHFQAAASSLGMDGVWEAQGLNHIFRLVKYEQGGHFSPHFDGEVVIDSETRSLLTLNMYLNGDFEGGTTQFLSESVELRRDEHLGNIDHPLLSRAVTASVKPATGLALIFSHHVLHQGDALGPGNPKWLLRSDILYHRVPGTAAVKSEPQQRAEALLAEACALESAGKADQAWRLYAAAFRLWPELEKTV